MGRVTVAGGNPGMKVPTTGIQAGTLAVGSTVKLMEGGTAVEYLVVNQGIPSNSSLYDASCDGTWLLRKDCHSKRVWNTSNINNYETSAINTWLNGDFFSSLGSVEQATIKQVKIPYRAGGGDGGTNQSGANGLSCKVFLLGGYELGWTTSDNGYFPVDGAKLAYFESGTGSSANNKRIAYQNNMARDWWTRSPRTADSKYVSIVSESGSYNYNLASSLDYIRPALVLPKTALFDETTLQLKGVA